MAKMKKTDIQAMIVAKRNYDKKYEINLAQLKQSAFDAVAYMFKQFNLGQDYDFYFDEDDYGRETPEFDRTYKHVTNMILEVWDLDFKLQHIFANFQLPVEWFYDYNKIDSYVKAIKKKYASSFREMEQNRKIEEMQNNKLSVYNKRLKAFDTKLRKELGLD